MMISAIIAAALSIASTNDYLFTRSLIPSNTVLVGCGVGTSGSNRLVRAEDVCFLREALAERYVAVKGPTYTNVPNMKIPLYVHGDIVADVADFAPESFDRTEWFYARGSSPSFVDPSFSLVTGTFPCTTNWTVHISGITYPDQDVRTSYLPFVSASTRRIEFDQSITNISARALGLIGPITNAYVFVQKLGSVTIAPASSCGIANYPSSATAIYADKTNTDFEHTYNQYTKTYRTPYDPPYDTVEYVVDTSVKSSREIPSRRVDWDSEMWYPRFRLSRIATVETIVPYTEICPEWSTTGGVADVTTYGSVRDAYHDWDLRPRTYNLVYVFGPYPRDLPNGVEATTGWLVSGWRWTVTDTKTFSGIPDRETSTETEILENECCVVVTKFTPRATTYETGKGLDRLVWSTSLSQTQMMGGAASRPYVDFKWGEEPEEVIPRGFPSTARTRLLVSHLTARGTHRIERKLECEWVSAVLVFRHTFNATFED